jgi:NADH dehydrogenase
VLVTGANGHLGRRLLAQVAGRRPALAVVRSARAARQLAEALGDTAVSTQVVDWRDAGALELAARGCEAAVHLVGILKESPTSRYEEAHEEACRALAAAADAAGLHRIVYLSILGSHEGSANACLASRGRAERILREAKTPALIVRVPMVLGEGDAASRALRARATAPLLALPRGGRSLEQPIYAGDVVQALMQGLERPELDGAELDLAGPTCLEQRELIRRAAALYGRRPHVIPVPAALPLALAFALERWLADPPVTRAMLGVLGRDDCIDPAESCRRLGIALTPLDETLRRCVGPEAP